LNKRDVIIIGGGTAGFLAAQTASLMGGNVLLVEKEKIGGICPNWGCIPMCFMDHCVEVVRTIKEADKDGISTGKLEIDYPRLMREKEKVVGGVIAGMEARLQATGVPVVFGSVELVSPDEVKITYTDGTQETVATKKIIITTGSYARRYEVPGAHDSGVLTARELLDLKELPESLAIIGRSITALELATIWSNLGSAVSLITRLPRLLPNEDEEIADYIRQILEGDGIQIYGGVDVKAITGDKEGKSVIISDRGKEKTVDARYVVFALGQSPNINDIGLESTGIEITDGGIKTNAGMKTSVEGIYAAGDVTGGKMLASTAMIQGMVAGRNAMGGDAAIDYRVVPRSIRTIPPISSVGITEAEAKENGIDVKVNKFPFEQSPKAKILRESRGFVKIVANTLSGEILGVHIIGPQAPELIHEAAAVMRMKGRVQDIAATIHGHPTLHETIQRVAQMMSI
jgi:dihydrolipoamide dehydrogenase